MGALEMRKGKGNPGERGGGGVPYNKSDGDARRLGALGCKLQILVSLRVFGMESHNICPFMYRFTKNALTLTT